MYGIVLATAQFIERAPNKLENEIKQNTDDAGIGIVYFMCQMCRYLHNRHFVLFLVSNLFGVLSIGCAVARNRTCIVD